MSSGTKKKIVFSVTAFLSGILQNTTISVDTVELDMSIPSHFSEKNMLSTDSNVITLFSVSLVFAISQ